MTDGPPTSSASERRLTAILAADIAGYSRLMGQDEAATVRDLKAHQAQVLPMIGQFGGTVVDTAGDGLLAAFPSAVRAVECGVAIQTAMAGRNRPMPSDRRMQYRIGVNLGDVIHEEARIFGDGVNVAARLQDLAEPGGVCVSGSAYEQVRGKLDWAFESLGEHKLKNIERPVRAFRIVLDRDGSRSSGDDLTAPDVPSIAVLPFDNMSPDPSQQFFSDGITEDITTALCKLKGFFVIARNTMFTFKGKSVDVKAVGRELGVRYVLEGSVRMAGNRIRVSAQLIEAASGNHLWGERYDRNLDDIFTIQDEITSSVVGCIEPELLAAEHTRANRKPPQTLDVWECTIGALFECGKLSDEGSRNALALLDRAVEVQPGYAQALGLKGWIKVWRALQGWEDMGDVLTEVRRLIGRALAEDAEEPWTYLAQSMVGFATRDNALSMSGTRRAIQINPNFAQAHGLMGISHAFGGRYAEALASVDRAVRLSPRELFHGDFHLFYAFSHFQGGRYDLGLQYAQQAHNLRPGHPYPMVIGAACAGHLGELKAATGFVRTLKVVVPTYSRSFIEATAPYELEADRSRLIEGLSRAGLN